MSHVAGDSPFIGAQARATARRLRVHWTDRVGNALLVAVAIALAIFLIAPMAMKMVVRKWPLDRLCATP